MFQSKIDIAYNFVFALLNLDSNNEICTILQRQIDVYHLLPNSSYWFRVWASNALGSSIPVETLGHTLYSDVDKGISFIRNETFQLYAFLYM